MDFSWNYDTMEIITADCGFLRNYRKSMDGRMRRMRRMRTMYPKYNTRYNISLMKQLSIQISFF